MNEEFESLETELAGIRPRRLTPDFASRIEAPLSLPRRGSWSDDLLVCAMGSGAIAACMIVALLLREPTWRAQDPPALADTPAPRAGDMSFPATHPQPQVASAWK